MVNGAAARPKLPPELAEQVQPVTLAMEQRVPVDDAFGSLFPLGLQRGSTIGFSGYGATTLACALAVAPMAPGAWAAVIGVPWFGWAAADALGMPLHQTVFVPQPERQLWGTVVAAAVDAFDVVIIGVPPKASGRDARRLESRLRERGGILLCLGQDWPLATDVVMKVTSSDWHGVGQGHGVLESRRATVEVTGRRGSARPRRTELWLPHTSGKVEAVAAATLSLVES